MNDFPPPDMPRSPTLPPAPIEDLTQGTSSLYRLFEAFIALREKNERQHKLFEQTMAKTRDALQASFNSFAADTQRAYQQLRQEIHGEKRAALAVFNELMEIGLDLERKPSPESLAEAMFPQAVSQEQPWEQASAVPDQPLALRAFTAAL